MGYSLGTGFGEDLFDKLFTFMIAASAVIHLVVAVMVIFLPPVFSHEPPKENVIQVEMLIKDLPEGPKIGTQAPTKNVSAARAPDHTLPWKKKAEEKAAMAMKQKSKKIQSKRINYKERERSSAIDRIKQLKSAQEGGGGSATQSGGNVFSIYLARVKRRIEAAWTLPPGLTSEEKGQKVFCKIKVGANGSIIASFVTKSSGLPHLDRSALAAISAVGTLPEPPPLIVKTLSTSGMRIVFDPMVK